MGTAASFRYREGVFRMLQVREISSAEVVSLASFYKELARCQNEVSTHFKGVYPVVPIAQQVAECADDLESGKAHSKPQYYRHLGDEPTLESLASELRELPPGCAPNRKRCLGFFDEAGALVAVMDLLRGYPSEAYGYIGFFMVAAEHQGRGVGTRIVSAVLDRLRAEGFRRVRLGYVQGNEQSEGFWRALGFTPAGDAVACGSCMVVPAELEL